MDQFDDMLVRVVTKKFFYDYFMFILVITAWERKIMSANASLRTPVILALSFGLITLGLWGYQQYSYYTNIDAARQQYEKYAALSQYSEAIIYGERAIKLAIKKDRNPDEIFALRYALAQTHIAAGDHQRAIDLLVNLVGPDGWRTLSPIEKLPLERDLAKAHILAGEYAKGISIYASFLELSSNNRRYTPAITKDEANTNIKSLYRNVVDDAAEIFADNFSATATKSILTGDSASQLATANQMVELGAYYALSRQNLYAAAGLLSSAYNTRQNHLPTHTRDLTQITMILGPIYEQIEKYDEAENLYWDAFRAQELIWGAQSTDLSLYTRLLANVYRKQDRITEADALFNYVKTSFNNANFYPEKLLKEKANPILFQPANGQSILPTEYKPNDLVLASAYKIPVSARIKQINNTPANDNASARSSFQGVQLSLANDITTRSESLPASITQQESNMPIRLSQMMSFCADRNRDSALTISDGFIPAQNTTKIDDAETNNNSSTTPFPQHIEHQLGLAVDFNVNGRLMRSSDQSWLCLRENAYRFGFISSFPQGDIKDGSIQPFEPWHWRYVGPQVATLLRQYGPINNPQDFLANIDCYQQQIGEDYSFNSQLIAQCNRRQPQSTSLHIQKFEKVNSHTIIEKALTNGPSFTHRGRLKEAKALYVSALKAREKEFSPNHPQVGLLIGLIADLYDRQYNDDPLVSTPSDRGEDTSSKSSVNQFRKSDPIAAALRAHMNMILIKSYNPHEQDQSSEEERPLDDYLLAKMAEITRPVSQYFLLHSSYIPNDLIAVADYNIPVSKDPTIDEMKLRFAHQEKSWGNQGSGQSDLPKHLSELINVCTQQSEGETLSLRSGYRAYQTQAVLYQRLRHRGTVTPPGMSEHQTGLAADIDVNGRFMREDDQAFSCFQDNAHHFGFILSYPKGNQYLPGVNTYEPWHWRYVGVDIAQLYHDAGPKNHPQEFLAALTCYKEQARYHQYLNQPAREGYDGYQRDDFCLYQEYDAYIDLTPTQEHIPVADRQNDPNSQIDKANNPADPPQEGEKPDTARILNKALRSGN